ncbi:hypothetical protein AAVH_26529 [Aphelenchoides avenae]|nr:hypothetical protein AAVH_26529 [Aphelenchus avenae]
MPTTRSYVLAYLTAVATLLLVNLTTEAKPLVDGFTSGTILNNLVGFSGFGPSYGYNYGYYSPYGYAYYGRR